MKTNPEDTVTMDIPLLIRMFEFMREEAKTDVEVHDVTERLISLSSTSKILTMSDYPRIVVEKNPEVDRIKQLSGIRKY